MPPAPTIIPDEFDVLLIKDSEQNAWVAHALQLDVAGQGSTIVDAIREVQFAMAAATLAPAIQQDAPWIGIGRAPQEYLDKFEAGCRVLVEAPSPPKVTGRAPSSIPTFREARVH